MNSLILTLHTKFSLKDLGPLHHFLGIEVSYTSDGGLFLSQKQSIVGGLQYITITRPELSFSIKSLSIYA
uniref:Reverse transcriptase Ty1/copia-type domain-containing protein n=1 Tax=Cajanus cajan TaxID=3821 RepID=A0A151TIT7_CAJCA|nr:hypothetical protein KK1_013264 [Cajanus cajan]